MVVSQSLSGTDPALGLGLDATPSAPCRGSRVSGRRAAPCNGNVLGITRLQQAKRSRQSR